ncbi:ABC transporter ATP-binding protein [Notoacmeibacter ruber]|uniref:ABC transporter ATP-binding protein n=1 Tax=Notoacmeibacter ruber TaxID=2670375 RepID=A0A3L7JG04_9HYPH|nr:ABC transporter ATP-binding protein [Notoacmeibacter ruber]RLQ89616.1 ABC transporter ATP-binding protein [Notoacmeibacter ruber]
MSGPSAPSRSGTGDLAVDLSDVSLTLGSGASAVTVLNDVGLSIRAGESLGIVGPSGSGKTTLLMVMSGLERVDRGRVLIAGTDITDLAEDDMARFRGRHVGIVFQSFHLVPNMTALENVAVPLELAGRHDAFEIADRELRAVGLADRIRHRPSQLSGGEQQRVAIARALAPTPSLLIADEPTGNLDQETGRHVADLLFQRAEEAGTTLVLVTHDPALAGRCDRTVAMRSGHIEAAEANGRRSA